MRAQQHPQPIAHVAELLVLALHAPLWSRCAHAGDSGANRHHPLPERHVLTLTHALVVALFTGIPLLGLAEPLLHAMIDLAKSCLGFSLALDQLLHLVCKLVLATLVALR